MSSEKFESLEDDLNGILEQLKKYIHDEIPGLYGDGQASANENITSFLGGGNSNDEIIVFSAQNKAQKDDKLKSKRAPNGKEYAEEKKNAKRQVEKKLEEASLLMQEMEQESKSAPQSYRIQMMNQLRNYRREIENLSRNFKMISENNTFDSGTNDWESKIEGSNRQKLFSGIQSLQRTSESIARSHQVAAETDEIGTGIIEDMSRQREVLERTKNRLDETDANLSKSRRIIKNIVRRVMTDKMILIAIILVELAALGGVVYYKYFRK